MPTATLQYPRSLHFHGHTYLQGVEERVSVSLVPLLKLDGRFDVDESDTTPAEIQKAVVDQSADRSGAVKKPNDPELVNIAIVQAYAALDPEDTDNFLKDGRPDARVLSKILGYTVSAEERDDALGFDKPDADPKPKPSNLKIGVKKAQEAAASVGTEI